MVVADIGQPGAQQPVVGAGQEQCSIQSGIGDQVAVAVLNRPGFRSYPVSCPTVAGRPDSWSA